MDWEPVVAVSQIATGLATLIVAVFLAGQFALQRKALNRAHEDADRDLSMSSVSLLQDYQLYRYTKEQTSKVWAKRNQGLDSFSESEYDTITTYLKIGYTQIITDRRLGRLINSPTYYHWRLTALLDSLCGQELYIQQMRNILIGSERNFVNNVPALYEIADKAYEELTGNPV